MLLTQMEFTCPNNVLFECSKCGLCCGDTKEKTRHILLLESEANTISAATCLPKQAFTGQITGKTPYCYEMKKNAEGECFFLKDNQCSIYMLRPLICRFYPFELKFDPDKAQHAFGFTLECPGISKGKTVTFKDFEELFLLAKERLP
ncbi:MAG: YkgJ family cysteine cluster protein [Chloroflexi bacterium]|nr:YkgJ family cysteine cluster protein [Chloroflexota bacterium]